MHAPAPIVLILAWSIQVALKRKSELLEFLGLALFYTNSIRSAEQGFKKDK